MKKKKKTVCRARRADSRGMFRVCPGVSDGENKVLFLPDNTGNISLLSATLLQKSNFKNCLQHSELLIITYHIQKYLKKRCSLYSQSYLCAWQTIYIIALD